MLQKKDSFKKICQQLLIWLFVWMKNFQSINSSADEKSPIYDARNGVIIRARNSSDDRSTIRDRLPRGHTRKLASLFEETSAEGERVDRQKKQFPDKRGKSVPAIPRAGRGSFVENKDSVRNIHVKEGRLVAVPIMEQCVEACDGNNNIAGNIDNVASAVKALVNRFETSTGGKTRPAHIENKLQMSLSALKQVQGMQRSLDTQDQEALHAMQKMDEKSNLVQRTSTACSIHPVAANQEIYGQSHWHVQKIVDPASQNAIQNWDHLQYSLGVKKALNFAMNHDDRLAVPGGKETRAFNADCRLEEHDIRPQVAQRTTSSIDSRAHDFSDNSHSVDENVAEVEKAFAFMRKAESLSTAREPVVVNSNNQAGGDQAAYPIDRYSQMEKKRNQSSPAESATFFAPLVLSSSAAAGITLQTYEHACADATRKTKEAVATDLIRLMKAPPLATSTPIEQSPVLSLSKCSRSERLTNVLDRSFISLDSRELENQTTGDLEMKIQAMRNFLTVQNLQLTQAMNALEMCRKKSSNPMLFELDALRGILLARERTRVYSDALQNLETFKMIKKSLPPLAKRMHGILDIISVDFVLNRNFCTNKVDEGATYAFVVVMKCEEQVEATQAKTLIGWRVRQYASVHFSDRMRFTNLPVGFNVIVEVYALMLEHTNQTNDFACAVLLDKAKNMLSPCKATGTSQNHGLDEVR